MIDTTISNKTPEQQDEVEIEDNQDTVCNDLIMNMEKQLNDIDSISPIAITKKKRVPKKKGIIDVYPPDEIVVRKQLVTTIMQYKYVFPKHMESYISKFDISYLDKLDTDSLKKFLEEIRVTVACLNSGSLVHHGYAGMCSIAEYIAPSVGLDLEGFSDDLMSNETVNNTLNEISLQSNLMYVRPEIRLLMSTLAVAQVTINRNKQKLKNPVSNTLLESSKDL